MLFEKRFFAAESELWEATDGIFVSKTDPADANFSVGNEKSIVGVVNVIFDTGEILDTIGDIVGEYLTEEKDVVGKDGIDISGVKTENLELMFWFIVFVIDGIL